MSRPQSLVSAVRRAFAAACGPAAAPPAVALSPARVNLIGEHVDHQDGLVLPMAIDRHVAVAFAPRADAVLRAHAAAPGETREARLADLAPPPAGAARRGDWFAYVAGTAWALREAGLPIPGADLAIAGSAPAGAGLASSAALELAVARALCAAADLPWDPVAMARRCRRAENRYVGVACGLMDQYASACGREGAALLLDCRSLECTPVPLPEEMAVVVMDTAAARRLAGSAYNERRAACAEAVRRLRALDPSLTTLRDVTPALLAAGHDLLRSPGDTLLRRARHVVEEMARPAALAAALAARDFAAAGRLVDASHASLRDLFEVSCPELELITGLARAHPACHGARLTGAGFGGSAIALVNAGDAIAFAAAVQAGYRERSDRPGVCFVCRAVAGTGLAAPEASSGAMPGREERGHGGPVTPR
ncbi:MAG: galactokinase [Candidatus Krumholzibacteriia bacterium]